MQEQIIALQTRIAHLEEQNNILRNVLTDMVGITINHLPATRSTLVSVLEGWDIAQAAVFRKYFPEDPQSQLMKQAEDAAVENAHHD